MIHASIHAIMPIVSLGTWKRFVNKFDPYVMYRSVYFFIFAFSGQKITCWHAHLSILIFTIGDHLTPLLGTAYPIQRVS